MNKPLLEAAHNYLNSDLSIVPVKSDKRPIPGFKWEEFQREPMDHEDIESFFPSAWGVAVIGGGVSGGLEVIDFDDHDKKHNIKEVFDKFCGEKNIGYMLSHRNIFIEQSPSGGFHLVYRYEFDGTRDGSQKLAAWGPNDVMIETRGEGGYTVIYPSPNYKLIAGDPLNIPTLSLEERDYLIHHAKTFSIVAEAKKEDKSGSFDNTDPVSFFNWHKAINAKKILEDKGWKKLRYNEKEGLEYWRRPGKDDDSHSATWGYKSNSLYVFSSSADPFKSECYYTPFQILTLLVFKGNHRAAVEWILSKYYEEDVPYLRVGCDYYKKITKVDRFEINRTEIKKWKKEEIIQDHGKKMLDKIPHFDDFAIKPDNFNYSPVINNCYNLYRPFTHTPCPGKWKWTDILLHHIFGEQYDLGIRYMHILYLHPDRIMPILVLVSKERQTGKTTFVNWLSIIFGDNIANINPEDLANGFNSIYAASNIIAVEETLVEKAETVEKIKALATQKFISVNRKFIDQYRLPFFGKVILTSNNENKFAKIDQEEIRFFIRKVPIPTVENHNIEVDMIAEIPAFLHHLTTLPRVDFSHDRSGFLPSELTNESLMKVKEESHSGVYETIRLHVEELFLNECSEMDEFYADGLNIKNKFFINDSRTDLKYIRYILKQEFEMKPTDKSIYYQPFGLGGTNKQGRPFLFKRENFTQTETGSKPPLPF